MIIFKTSFCPQLRTRILLLMPATTGSSKSKIWNIWCRILRPGDGKTTGWATRLESFQIFHFCMSTGNAHQTKQLLLRRHSLICYSVAELWSSTTVVPDLQMYSHSRKCCSHGIMYKQHSNSSFVSFWNIKAIAALYDALIRSQLEYNAGIWAPHDTKYSLMLERIQNKLIRFLYITLI